MVCRGFDHQRPYMYHRLYPHVSSSVRILNYNCNNVDLKIIKFRETIAHTFANTPVQNQLIRYEKDSTIRDRWDTLQKSYECCGGGSQGYRDWANRDGRLVQGM